MTRFKRKADVRLTTAITWKWKPNYLNNEESEEEDLDIIRRMKGHY